MGEGDGAGLLPELGRVEDVRPPERGEGGGDGGSSVDHLSELEAAVVFSENRDDIRSGWDEKEDNV